MLLEGAKLICLNEDGTKGEVHEAKGRNFTIGYYSTCNYNINDARSKGIHCEIQCDAFGHVYVHNMSAEHPVKLNGNAVDVKQRLLNNAIIEVLDKKFLWEFPRTAGSGDNENFNEKCKDALLTPQNRLIKATEEPCSSCPNLRTHRIMPKRLTVHNFHNISIGSTEEGNSSAEYDNDDNEEIDKTTEKPIENVSLVVETCDETAATTPGPKQSESQLMLPSKSVTVNCTPNKLHQSTPKKNNLLATCARSDILVTCFSPRRTGVHPEKSFGAVVNEVIPFNTPGSLKKYQPQIILNSPMHLVDCTLPTVLRPASPSVKSTLLKGTPTKRDNQMNATKLIKGDQLGLKSLPETPKLRETPQIGTPIEIDSSDISVDSPSVIEISDSSPDVNATTQSLSKTPLSVKTATTKTPQSLMKRALMTSAKKQFTTTPARPGAFPATPATPKNATSAVSNRQTLSTPRRKISTMSSKVLMKSSNALAGAGSFSRRSSLNPLVVRAQLASSTPQRALTTTKKTSSLHRIRKSVGGVPLSSHISKVRRSILMGHSRASSGKESNVATPAKAPVNVPNTSSNTTEKASDEIDKPNESLNRTFTLIEDENMKEKSVSTGHDPTASVLESPGGNDDEQTRALLDEIDDLLSKSAEIEEKMKAGGREKTEVKEGNDEAKEKEMKSTEQESAENGQVLDDKVIDVETSIEQGQEEGDAISEKKQEAEEKERETDSGPDSAEICSIANEDAKEDLEEIAPTPHKVPIADSQPSHGVPKLGLTPKAAQVDESDGNTEERPQIQSLPSLTPRRSSRRRASLSGTNLPVATDPASTTNSGTPTRMTTRRSSLSLELAVETVASVTPAERSIVKRRFSQSETSSPCTMPVIAEDNDVPSKAAANDKNVLTPSKRLQRRSSLSYGISTPKSITTRRLSMTLDVEGTEEALKPLAAILEQETKDEQDTNGHEENKTKIDKDLDKNDGAEVHGEEKSTLAVIDDNQDIFASSGDSDDNAMNEEEETVKAGSVSDIFACNSLDGTDVNAENEGEDENKDPEEKIEGENAAETKKEEATDEIEAAKAIGADDSVSIVKSMKTPKVCFDVKENSIESPNDKRIDFAKCSTPRGPLPLSLSDDGDSIIEADESSIIDETQATPVAASMDLDKFFNTPRAKDLMIPNQPLSVKLEKSRDSVELVQATTVDLNATLDGNNDENLKLEDLFKTPVAASRFVGNENDEKDGEEDNERGTLAKEDHEKELSSAEESKNLSSEEVFDKLTGQPPSSIVTPVRKVYSRKSPAGGAGHVASPFSATDIISDLPKTDVQEWVDSLEDQTPLQSNNEEIETEEERTYVAIPENNGEQNLTNDQLAASASKSTEYHHTRDASTMNVTNASDAMDVNVSTAAGVASPAATTNDQLAVSASRPPTESGGRKTEPLPWNDLKELIEDADISGIDLLDQTGESVFSEPLIISDTESINGTQDGAKELEETKAKDESMEKEGKATTCSDYVEAEKIDEKEAAKVEAVEKIDENLEKKGEKKSTTLINNINDSKNLSDCEAKEEVIKSKQQPEEQHSALIDDNEFENFKENDILSQQRSKTPHQHKARSKLSRKTMGAEEDLQINIDFEKEKLQRMQRDEKQKPQDEINQTKLASSATNAEIIIMVKEIEEGEEEEGDVSDVALNPIEISDEDEDIVKEEEAPHETTEKTDALIAIEVIELDSSLDKVINGAKEEKDDNNETKNSSVIEVAEAENSLEKSTELSDEDAFRIVIEEVEDSSDNAPLKPAEMGEGSIEIEECAETEQQKIASDTSADAEAIAEEHEEGALEIAKETEAKAPSEIETPLGPAKEAEECLMSNQTEETIVETETPLKVSDDGELAAAIADECPDGTDRRTEETEVAADELDPPMETATAESVSIEIDQEVEGIPKDESSLNLPNAALDDSKSDEISRETEKINEEPKDIEGDAQRNENVVEENEKKAFQIKEESESVTTSEQKDEVEAEKPEIETAKTTSPTPTPAPAPKDVQDHQAVESEVGIAAETVIETSKKRALARGGRRGKIDESEKKPIAGQEEAAVAEPPKRSTRRGRACNTPAPIEIEAVKIDDEESKAKDENVAEESIVETKSKTSTRTAKRGRQKVTDDDKEADSKDIKLDEDVAVVDVPKRTNRRVQKASETESVIEESKEEPEAEKGTRARGRRNIQSKNQKKDEENNGDPAEEQMAAEAAVSDIQTKENEIETKATTTATVKRGRRGKKETQEAIVENVEVEAQKKSAATKTTTSRSRRRAVTEIEINAKETNDEEVEKNKEDEVTAVAAPASKRPRRGKKNDVEPLTETEKPMEEVKTAEPSESSKSTRRGQRKIDVDTKATASATAKADSDELLANNDTAKSAEPEEQSQKKTIPKRSTRKRGISTDSREDESLEAAAATTTTATVGDIPKTTAKRVVGSGRKAKKTENVTELKAIVEENTVKDDGTEKEQLGGGDEPEMKESPKKRTVPRRAARHDVSYDEGSDIETEILIQQVLQGTPRTVTKLEDETITSSRGRTRKPTALVQQYLEEERARTSTPKRRVLLSAIDSPALEVIQPPPPPKRGRKPSTTDKSAVTESSESTLTSTSALAAAPAPASAPVKKPPVTRKRNQREAKPAVVAVESPAVNHQSTDEIAKPTVRRGRAAANATPAAIEAAARVNNDEDEEVAVTVKDPPKRGGGRQRKNETSVESLSASKEIASQPTIPATGRGGRKVRFESVDSDVTAGAPPLKRSTRRK